MALRVFFEMTKSPTEKLAFISLSSMLRLFVYKIQFVVPGLFIQLHHNVLCYASYFDIVTSTFILFPHNRASIVREVVIVIRLASLRYIY